MPEHVGELDEALMHCWMSVLDARDAGNTDQAQALEAHLDDLLELRQRFTTDPHLAAAVDRG